MFNKKYINNSAWIILQQCYTLIFSSIIGIIITRYLGPENYGKYEYVNSIIAILAVVCGVGLDNIIVFEMSKKENNVGEILGSAIFLKVVVSIIIYIILFFLASYVEKDSLLCTMLRIHGIYLIFQVITLFNQWFLMEMKSKIYSIFNMIALTISGGYKLLLLWGKKDVWYFSFSQVIESATILLAILFFIHKKSAINFTVSFERIKELLKKCGPFIVADLAIIIYSQIDKVMISKMLGEYEVGIYSVASYIATFWQFVPLALINSASPLIINEFHKNDDKYESKIEKIIVIVSVLCLVVVAGMGIFGEMFVLILYGKAYEDAKRYIFILAISVWISMLGCIGSTWIICNELNKYSAYRTVLGMITNIILNYILIKRIGIMGAAVATLLSQFMVVIVYTFVFKKTRRIISLYFKALVHTPQIVADIVKKL